MSDEKRQNIHRLIDAMQTNLVELYDIMNELRSLLVDVPLSDMNSPPIFSEVKAKRGPSEDHSHKTDANTSEADKSEFVAPKIDSSTTSKDKAVQPEETRQLNEARVSRVLDPITFELENANSPAEVVAEYVQSAKDDLITERNPNSKVAQDMDIVLKFLRARGPKPINQDERENILRRIKRWHDHLLSH